MASVAPDSVTLRRIFQPARLPQDCSRKPSEPGRRHRDDEETVLSLNVSCFSRPFQVSSTLHSLGDIAYVLGDESDALGRQAWISVDKENIMVILKAKSCMRC